MNTDLASVAEEVLQQPGPAAKLQRYADLLLQEGDRLGLTSLRDRDRILGELVVDSLAALSWISDGTRVLDLGSGGGCPGLPLAICRPECDFVLVEANQRKSAFLQQATRDLDLPRVTVMSQRSEDLARQPKHRASYDIVVAKAVAPMNTLIELALPLLVLGGSLIAYKGPTVGQEIESSQRALGELKAVVAQVVAYRNGDRSLHLCQILKQGPTPRRYPRRAGIPNKQPLAKGP